MGNYYKAMVLARTSWWKGRILRGVFLTELFVHGVQVQRKWDSVSIKEDFLGKIETFERVH